MNTVKEKQLHTTNESFGGFTGNAWQESVLYVWMYMRAVSPSKFINMCIEHTEHFVLLNFREEETWS